MKTDRLCFPFVALAIIGAMVLALIDPTPKAHASTSNARSVVTAAN
jgi:hypothetical protein